MTAIWYLGDIVLEDGSYVSPENFIKGLTAVAVIFRTADEENSIEPLGLGTVQGSSLNWASADTFGCSNETESLNCKIEGIDENIIYTLSGTTDGSTSWSSLITDYETSGSSLTSPEAASEEEKYQAFNFCLSYGEKYNLADSIKKNWYLPTLSEFYCIYENLNAKEWANMVLLNTYIKKLKENYGLSNSQIYFTLMYMYEYEDPPADPMEKETDVFLVIRYFQKAKQFWQEYKAIKVPGPDTLERILTAPPIEIVINRSEIIRKEEEDAKKRAKRNHREEIDGDDIIDDGIINSDFDYLEDKHNWNFYNNYKKWED